MADELKIIVKHQLDQSTNQINKLNEQIKKISSKIKEKISLKLQIDTSNVQVITKQIDEVQKKLKTKTITKNSLFINKKVEQQAFNAITARLREVKNNIDELAKVRTKYSIDAQGKHKLETATLTYYNKELGQTINETMKWVQSTKQVNGELQKINTFQTVDIDVADDMAKANNEMLKINAQKEKSLQYEQRVRRAIEETNKKLEIQLNKIKERAKADVEIVKIYGNRNQLQEAQKLNEQIQQTSSLTGEAAVNVRKYSDNLREMARQTKTTAKSTMSLKEMVLTAVKAFSIWIGVSQVVMTAIRSIRDGIESIVELDTSLTELNKVADLTSSQLENITAKAYEAGKAIGRTGKEVIDATAQWVRAGYNINEAFDLSQQSLLLTNISDGINDVTEASSSLIAILKGFKMEASDTAHVVDALNEVSNNFAVNTNNLTEILKRTSGTIAQTGTSYEELLGLATAGFESLRNAEMVASGINMISQRLRGMTEDGEEAVDLIPKIQAAFDKYTKGTVSIIDKQNGGLNSTYEILKQLHEIYPTLTDEAKAYINEAVAGNRQNKVLVSILENWQSVEGAIKSATNSLGSAQKENEKYLNSIQGKINQFNSAVQQMWFNTIDSDVIKFFVDLGTVLIKLVDTVGILNIALIALIGYLQFFSHSALLAPVINTIATSVYGLATSMGVATGAASALGAALGTIAPFAIIAGIVLLVKNINNLNDSFIKTQQAINESYAKTESSINQLKAWQQEYENLAKKTQLTRDEKFRLLEIERELKTRFGETAEAIDLQNGSLDKNIELMNKLQQEQAKRFILLHKKDYEEAKKALEDFYTYWFSLDIPFLKGKIQGLGTIEDYIKHFENLLENVNDLSDHEYDIAVNALKDLYKQYDAIIDITDKYETYQKVLNDRYKEFNEEVSNISSSLIDNQETLAQLSQSQESLNKIFSDSTDELKTLNQVIDDVKNNQSLSADTVAELILAYPELAASIKKLADGYTIELSAIEAVRKAKIQEKIDAINAEKAKAKATLENSKARLQAYNIEIEAINSLAKAQMEAAKIQSNKPLLTGNQTRFMTPEQVDSYYDDSEVQNLRKSIIEYGKLIEQVNALQDLLGKIGTGGRSSGRSSSVKEKYKPIVDEYLNINNAIKKVNQALEENSILLDQATGQDKIRLLKERADLYKEQEENLKALNNQQKEELELLKSQLSSKGFTFDVYNNITNYAERLKQFTGDSAKEVEELIERFVELQTNAIPGTSNEILKLRNEIIKTGSEASQIIEEAKQKQLEYVDKVFNAYYNHLFEAIDDEIEKLQDSKERIQEIYEERIESINEEIESLEKAKESAIDAINSRIKIYENEIKLLEERNRQLEIEEERQNRLNDIAKQREKLANIQKQKNVKIYQNGEWVWVADPKALREETEKLQELEQDYYKWEEDLRRKNEIEELRDQIEHQRQLLQETENYYNRRIEKLRESVTIEQEELRKLMAAYDDKIDNLQEFSNQQREILETHNEFQISSMEELRKSLIGIDQSMYNDRLDMLKEFVNKYKKMIGQTGTLPDYKKDDNKDDDSDTHKHNIKVYEENIRKARARGNEEAARRFEEALREYKRKYNIKGYITGGVEDETGLRILHGKPNAVETVFNAEQGKKLFNFVKSLPNHLLNMSTLKLNIPNINKNTQNQNIINNYNVRIGKVETSDAESFVDILPTLATQN